MKNNPPNLNCLVGTITFDKNNIIQTFDVPLENLFGYQSSDIVGKPLSTIIFHSGQIDAAAHQHREISRSIGREQELAGRNSNGTVFPVWITVDEIRQNDGRSLVATVMALPGTASASTTLSPFARPLASPSPSPSTSTSPSELLSAASPLSTPEPTLKKPETTKYVPSNMAAPLMVKESMSADSIYLESPVSTTTLEVDAIIQAAISGIFTFDDNGIIHLFNPAAEKIFGWTQGEIKNKNISVLLEEPFPLQHDAYLRSFLTTKSSKIIGTEREVIACRKDQTKFPAHMAIGHVKLTGDTHFFVGFIADISEQKNYEANLKMAMEKAETNLRAKTEFIANMSHEIRTPMSTIIGYSDILLQDAELSARSVGHVQTILSSAKLLMNIINDTLDFSKLGSGKFTLEAVAFHLPNLLTETIKLVDHEAQQKKLKITVEYCTQIPLRFIGDPTRLKQVVLNLVKNAVKFTHEGSVTVSVKADTSKVESHSHMLHFSVKDTGIGMTPEQASNVFESFHQADPSIARQYGGSGLGTTICKQITTLMDGEIWVESKFGQGSTFHFTAHLPEATSTDKCLYEHGNAIVEGYVSPRLFSVLLVEDIEANATLVMLRLKEQGHEVVWQTNGVDGVRAFQQNNFDLILMDIVMPDMDGLEATRKIRQLEESSDQHIPIFALTASIMQTEYESCIQAGMDSVHAKPIDFNDLLLTMEQIVPKNKGKPNTEYKINVITNEINFSSLEGIVDHNNAIKTWHDPNALAKALTSFATDRINDADKIEKLLMVNEDNLQPAYEIAHTLKGLAGNLYLLKVADSAVKIDAEIKAKHRKGALEEIENLRSHLKEAATMIAKLG